MGLYITITQERRSDDLVLDCQAATQELAQGVMEDYFISCENQHAPRFLEIATKNSSYGDVKKGDVVFVNEHDDNKASGAVEVWSTFSLDAAKVIAKHITQGELILRMDIEGNDPEYFGLRPGHAGVATLGFTY